ncbi:MAG: FtsX-like permease family protein [Proteobacteria bacterium]|nr:FtsX-like permease family protein [Pseudomonadota bacterium]
MPVLYRASLGYLRRHPWQLFLAILGICIGVAVMVAVDLANASARKAFISTMDILNGDASHQIIGGPGGIDESLYVDLRVRHGVRDIAPVVSGSIRINGTTMQLLGVDMFAEREFRSFVTLASDSETSSNTAIWSAESLVRGFLSGEPNVLLSSKAASEFGVRRGDNLDLIANGKKYSVKLMGMLGGDDRQQLSNLVIADISLAQDWLGLQGKLTRIDVKIVEGDEETATRIASLLPSGAELLSAAGRTQTTAAMSDAFMTNLNAMSLLALLVGVFLIYNSVAFAVLQRRGLIGVLRALGVTRSETFRLILGEAAFIGLAGAAAGVVAGIWLGERLVGLVAQTISDHYFAVQVTDVAIGPLSILKGVVAGLGATLVAAAVPALEASSYQPRLAMTRSVIEQRTGTLLPTLCLGGLLLIAVSAGLLWASGSSLVAGLVALFLLILGFAFCIPLFVKHASSVLEPLAGRLGGTAGRLAIGGVGKTLSRTGVAIVALSIAVSATIGVSVMVDSFRDSVNDWLNTTLQADIYVGVPRGSVDPALVADVVAVSGIEAYSTSRRNWLETATGRIRVIALQKEPGSFAGTRIREGKPADVWNQFDNEGAVLVSDAYAFRLRLAPGDSVQLKTGQGMTRFSVAAVYQSYDSNDGAVMMSRATYDSHFDDPGVDSLGLSLQPGIGADVMIDRLRAISEGRQVLVLSSNASIRELSLRIFDRTFVITNVLYWLAVSVAAIGILGAMLALQLERAKEFGVLRAIGMTPGQTGVLVSVQSGFIGLLSGLASIPLGLVMAWVLIEVINRRAFGWQIDFTVNPTALLWALALAVGAALIAGIYPALNAAYARPALAMRDE